MTVLDRLSRFGSKVTTRASPIWASARLQSERGLQWLKLRPQAVFWATGISIALAFLVFSGATAAGAALLGWAALTAVVESVTRRAWQLRPRYQYVRLPFALPSQSHSPPALLVRRTANQTQADFVNGLLRQAATASKRHQEQTNADRQRRI